MRRRRCNLFSAGYQAPHRRKPARRSGLKGALTGMHTMGMGLVAALLSPFSKQKRRAGKLAAPPPISSTPVAVPVLGTPPMERAPGADRRAGQPQWKDYALIAGILCSTMVLVWAVWWSDDAIDVTLEMNGRTRAYHTKAATVGELFEYNGVSLNTGDTLHLDGVSGAPGVPMDTALVDGMVLTVMPAFPVAVASRGEVQILHMQNGSVGEALSSAGVVYDADDEISRLIYEDVRPGMHIQHVDVEVAYEAQDVRVAYREEVIRNDKKYNTHSELKVEGKDGEKRIVRKLTYKDGLLASREIMHQIMLTEPVNEVKEIGTITRYQTNYKDDTRLWRAKPTSSEIKSTIVATEITAYTHTGRRTSTGKWPKIGYVAVNPSVIPYGTKLYIPGYGYCTAQDTGAFRHEDGGTKNQIDVFLNTASECKKWGRKYNVTIYILK